MLSDGGLTSPDIWIVISIIIIALISIVLNPLVFRHNFYKKNSIARDLYMALSATDLLTSIFTTTLFSVGILSPKEEQCFKEHNETFCKASYYKYNRTATTTEKVAGSVAWSLGFIPIIITAVLSFSRWYQISFPFRTLHRKAVKIVLAVVICAMVSYFSWKMFMNSSKTVMSMTMQLTTWFTPKESTLNTSITSLIALFLMITSNIAAGFTVWNIVKTPAIDGNLETRARKIRSSVRILMLNAGNLAWNILLVSRMLTKNYSEAYVTQLVALSFVPTILSSYNPVVYVALARGILKFEVL